MKRTLTIAIACLLGTSIIHAQCVPDSTFTGVGISADTLPTIIEGQSYDQTVTVGVPADTVVNGTFVNIVNFTIDQVIGLPSWLTFQCVPATCAFPPGLSCARIMGNPPCGSAGLYPLTFFLTINASIPSPFGGIPISIQDTIAGLVFEVLPVPAPENLIASPAISTATLSWDPVAGAVGYEVQGGILGGSPINVTLGGNGNTTLAASDLDDDQCYNWRVRSYCDATTPGAWSLIDTFCTLPCPAPTGLAASVQPDNTVILSWNPEPAALGYVLQGGPAGSVTAVQLVLTPGSTASLTTNPLTADSYEWRIRTGCSTAPILSPYTGIQSFTVPGSPQKTEGAIWDGPVSFRVHPNPATEQIRVDVSGLEPGTPAELRLLDLQGKMLLSRYWNTAEGIGAELNLGPLAGGLYQLLLQTEEHTLSQKLVISR